MILIFLVIFNSDCKKVEETSFDLQYGRLYTGFFTYNKSDFLEEKIPLDVYQLQIDDMIGKRKDTKCIEERNIRQKIKKFILKCLLL